MYKYDEVFDICKKYFNGDELATTVLINKYLLRDKDGNLLENHPDQMFERLSNEFFRIEQKYESSLTKEEIQEAFKGFRYIIPQGSPLFGIGNNNQLTSLANCFVIDSPEDSYGGIIQKDEELAQIMKRRGGVGIDLSSLRPKDVPINNAAKTSDGIVSFMERYSNTTKEVAQGGRRGALLISLSSEHVSLPEFIDAKRDLKKITGANISVKWSDKFLDAADKDKEYTLKFPINTETPVNTKKIKAKEVWNRFVENAWMNGEPGCLFWDKITKHSLSDCYDKHKTLSTNPCITGDTLVYVADGRGNVKIKTLANEGKDVPVFCFDKNDNVKIRLMRNPRVTGYNQPIYKITLDDGCVLRVTQKHKFKLTNGQYQETQYLKPGDSLKIITKFEAALDDIFKQSNSRSADYYWINAGFKKGTKSEHRLIAEYFNGNLHNNIVHHIDKNSKNNSTENLQIMSKIDHDKFHGDLIRGNNNPMVRAQTEWSTTKWQKYHDNMSKAVTGTNNARYSKNMSDDMFIDAANTLCIKLGRRFSRKEYVQYLKENKYPIHCLATYRSNKIGTWQNLAEQAVLNNKLDKDEQSIDLRTLKILTEARHSGYNAKIINKHVIVNRTCEYCGNPFETNYNRREIAYCSTKCAITKTSKDPVVKAKIAQARKIHGEKIISQHLDTYCKLKNILGRSPLKSEWEIECKKNNIPSRICTPTTFNTYKELQAQAELHNHRVVSIEIDGFEDVYNGTVDEFHNFFIGGFEGITANKKKKWIYVNNLQCGELPLDAYGSCILMTMNLTGFVDNIFRPEASFNFEKFNRYLYIASKLIDDLIDLELEKIDAIIQKIKNDPESDKIKRNEIELWQRIKENYLDGRRVGLGITGLADTLAMLNIKYSSAKAIEKCEEIFKFFHTTLMDHQSTIAQQRKPFKCWDWEKEKDNPYIKILSKSVQEKIKEVGRRNITITTVPPTGSISILAQISSGVEPLFKLKYNRKRKMSQEEINKNIVPESIDSDGIKWISYDVEHHGLQKWKEVHPNKKEDLSPYHENEANSIDWKCRVKLQGVLQKYITSAISSTINLPKTTTKEEVNQIYMAAWKEGCKGITIYRDGSRAGILTTKDEGAKVSSIKSTSAPDRPEILPCDIKYSSIDGHNWIFFVGLMEGRPYEIFGGKKSNIEIPKKHKTGWIKKNGKNEDGVRMYDLYLGSLADSDEQMIIKDIASVFSFRTGSYTRMFSGMLSHGMPIKFICEQLYKDNNASMFTFEKGIARILKTYIKDGENASGACESCKSEKLEYRDGCVYCSSCGWSKCL